MSLSALSCSRKHLDSANLEETLNPALPYRKGAFLLAQETHEKKEEENPGSKADESVRNPCIRNEKQNHTRSIQNRAEQRARPPTALHHCQRLDQQTTHNRDPDSLPPPYLHDPNSNGKYRHSGSLGPTPTRLSQTVARP